MEKYLLVSPTASVAIELASQIANTAKSVRACVLKLSARIGSGLSEAIHIHVLMLDEVLLQCFEFRIG